MDIAVEDKLTDAIDAVEGARQLLECAAACENACSLSWEGAAAIESTLESGLRQLKEVQDALVKPTEILED